MPLIVDGRPATAAFVWNDVYSTRSGPCDLLSALPEEPMEPTIQQLFDLTGRTALLTGGAGHLGSTMGRALAEAGASVILTSRDAHRAAAQASTLPGPALHHGIALDHMSPDSVDAGFEEAVR